MPSTIDAVARAHELEQKIARLQRKIAVARQAGANPLLIERAERKALELLEEREAIVQWSRAVNGLPWDRAVVARHLLNVAWRGGDMAAALELADALLAVEQARLEART
ncbi:MAG: hypothetical protein HY690_03950 [Chloroflexi bacterium]|nr:hypothetical protein [Chloroflexota bacterium]